MATIACVVLSSNLAIATNGETIEQIQAEVQSCMPVVSDEVRRNSGATSYNFQLIGTVQESDPGYPYRHYHLFDVLSPWEFPDYTWQTIIAIDGAGQCYNLIPERTRVETLTEMLPWGTAQQIALMQLQYLGADYIQQRLNTSTANPEIPRSPSEYTLSPEEAWALGQLGYAIPSEFTILPVVQSPNPNRTYELYRDRNQRDLERRQQQGQPQ